MSSDPTEERDPAFANAYAISFRLLGDRDRATLVASRAAASQQEIADPVTSDDDDADRPQDLGRSLEEIAGRSVELSLQAGEVGTPEHAEQRRALRMRFGAADPTTRAAAALVQLAGYSESFVAAEMDLTPPEVRELVGAFDPPPGVSWADLGDPLLRDRAVRRRRRGPRIPVFWIAGGVLVVVLAVWAVTIRGERPTLEGQDHTGPGTDVETGAGPDATTSDATTSTVTPDASGTSFGPGVGALASAGCAAPGSPTQPGPRELVIQDTAVATYDVEGDTDASDPQRLVVLVSEEGLPAPELVERSGIFGISEGSLQVSVDPLDGPGLGSAGLPQLLDELVSTRCVDMNRIVVVGFGTGAAATARLVCSDPGLVAGVAMVAGWAEPTCEPDPTVAVSIVAAADDPSVESGNALEEIGAAWADAVGAGNEVVDGRDEETIVRTWSGPGDVAVQTTSTLTGGHTWTVGASLSLNPFVTDTARALG